MKPHFLAFCYYLPKIIITTKNIKTQFDLKSGISFRLQSGISQSIGNSKVVICFQKLRL